MIIQEQILTQIIQAQTIIIQRHQRPDPDAFGSQCGLAEILRASFPEKKIYQVGKKIPALEWLATQDEVADEVYQDALVIVTDTANAPRIDDQRYLLAKMVIKIDHHPNDEPYGDLMYVNPQASSCSEIIYDLVTQSHKQLKLTDEAARLLYAGIVGDTGRFLYDCTSSHTLAVASALRKYNFDAVKLSRQMDDISLPVARLSAYVWEKMTMTAHKAAYIVLSNEILEKFALKDAGTSDVVPLLGKIEDVVCWAVIVEQKDGTYRLRIRSKGPVINELAKQYQGGGHPLASGARISEKNQIAQFVEQLDQIAATQEIGEK